MPAELTQMLPSIIIMAVLLLVFYFMLIRPENKRKKELAKMRKEVDVGDTIVTIGGIVGRIISSKDDSIVIETVGGSKIKMMRWSISSVVNEEEEAK